MVLARMSQVQRMQRPGARPEEQYGQREKQSRTMQRPQDGPCATPKGRFAEIMTGGGAIHGVTPGKQSPGNTKYYLHILASAHATASPFFRRRRVARFVATGWLSCIATALIII
jgi:hypothetical protein